MLLAVTTVICPMNVFAMEPTDGEQTERQETAIVETGATVAEISPQSVGQILATGVGTIYGTGTITVFLPSGNWFADFVAGVSYASQGGIVNCSVRTPDGKTFSLGSISGSGKQTDSHQETYASAGNYTFYFSSTIPEYNVYARIHD